MVHEGERAPDFTLAGTDENGGERDFSLKDFRGKAVVLYFYPRDNTPGCTTEACDFRDSMNRLAPRCTVLGVSPDGPDSHKRFREKHGLNFPLLSDPDKRVAALYGAFGEKKMYGKVTKGIIRSTFLIDENGTVRKVWRKVKVKGHVDEVIGALSALEAQVAG